MEGEQSTTTWEMLTFPSLLTNPHIVLPRTYSFSPVSLLLLIFQYFTAGFIKRVSFSGALFLGDLIYSTSPSIKKRSSH